MKNKNFEENYFGGWFKHAVGDFSKKDLEVSKNWFSAWLKKLEQYVPLKRGQGKTILELGCSIGSVSELLSQRGFDVTATDVSALAVKNAKKLLPHITFKQLDAENFTTKKKYDIVLSFEVTEHLENPLRALKNMREALKDNGYLVFSSPYPYPWIYNDPTHINVKHPKEWYRLIQRAGFKKIEHHKFALAPFFYRFNKRFQVIIPFHIPLPMVNNPIFYIARKK